MLFSLSVNKMSPRPSLVPEPDPQTPTDNPQTTATLQAVQRQLQQNLNNNSGSGGGGNTPGSNNKTEPGIPASRAGACRVCLKGLKPEDYSKTCFECQYRVCEDCASYSKFDQTDEGVRL